MILDQATTFIPNISNDSVKSFIVQTMKEADSKKAETKDDELKSLLEGSSPLTGGFIVPALDLRYNGRIGLNNRDAISGQFFIGNDLDIKGDTLGTEGVRGALSRGYFVPEASSFRFNISWVHAFNKWKTKERSEDKDGDVASSTPQNEIEKAFFIGTSLDIVSKKIPVSTITDSDTIWSKNNYEVVYLTLTSQYRIAEGENFQIGLYCDWGIVANASKRDEIERYYSTLGRPVSASQWSIVPKLGIEAVFDNVTVDLGYIFKTESVEQYFQSNDPGFFAVKLGISTNFKRN